MVKISINADLPTGTELGKTKQKENCYNVTHDVTNCYNVTHDVTKCYNVTHDVTMLHMMLQSV